MEGRICASVLPSLGRRAYISLASPTPTNSATLEACRCDTAANFFNPCTINATVTMPNRVMPAESPPSSDLTYLFTNVITIPFLWVKFREKNIVEPSDNRDIGTYFPKKVPRELALFPVWACKPRIRVTVESRLSITNDVDEC